MNVFENRDCMDGMAEFPDNHFDLAIVDPPYGIGADKKNSTEKNKVKNQIMNGIKSRIKI